MFNKMIEKLYFKQVGNLATYDQFTGCLNRNWFERFASKIEYNYIIVVDINGLKFTNDTKGHGEGDKLIKSVSSKLLTAFSNDYVCRYGGDEFYIFTKDFPLDMIESIHDKSFSYGIGETLQDADQSMYTMKRLSKNSRRFA